MVTRPSKERIDPDLDAKDIMKAQGPARGTIINFRRLPASLAFIHVYLLSSRLTSRIHFMKYAVC